MSSVVLIGMPGAGKSTVGRQLAELLDLPFVDTDTRIEQRCGMPCAEVITRQSEEEFRRIEAGVIAEVCAEGPAVIATGGGAVVDPLSRWHLWHAGTVIWLDAPDHILRNRLTNNPQLRPLTQNPEQLAARRYERMPFYRAADIHADASEQVERLAASLVEKVRRHRSAATPGRLLMHSRVRRDHPMGPRKADVMFFDGVRADQLTPVLTDVSTGECVVVADENAAAALPAMMSNLPTERRLTFAAGEENKRLATVEQMLEFAASRRAERSDAWIAVGGGTTGDMVGCAAALYMRGAPLIQFPTTWLAMCDAAIGGKVAVDLSAAKNSAGAFWPPAAVVADTRALHTLSADLLLDGMGETVKSAIIGDPWLWDLIVERGQAALRPGGSASETEHAANPEHAAPPPEDAAPPLAQPDLAARYAMVERSALLKLGVVERDPFEQGERRTLNLGHTIGHALEIESGYRLPHGRAVILGLRAVAHMAAARGAESTLQEQIDDVVATLGFDLTRSFDPARVLAALRGDKKALRGKIRWILPMDIGRVEEADDISDTEIMAALEHIQA